MGASSMRIRKKRKEFFLSAPQKSLEIRIWYCIYYNIKYNALFFVSGKI